MVSLFKKSLPGVSSDVFDPRAHRVLVTGGSGFIGVNLMAELLRMGVTAVNLDIAAPLDEGQVGSWRRGDVLERRDLDEVMAEMQPTHVVHLAARVDLGGKGLDDYAVNVEGTRNLISCLADSTNLERLVVASTQFVVAPGYTAASDTDTAPHTVYGESKVRAEEVTRRSALPWVIVRPTTVWGPHDLAYRRQFYRAIYNGFYLHPRGLPCFRSLGYVENVVDQLVRIVAVPEKAVVGGTFYLGDPILNLIEFVETFSLRIRERSVRHAPRGLVRSLALVGDVLKSVGLPAPISTQRYRSMTENYIVPLAGTFDIVGPPRFSLAEAVDRTVRWLGEAGEFVDPSLGGHPEATDQILDEVDSGDE